MEEYKRCPYCDERIRYSAVKCKHCGSILTNSQHGLTGIITPETQIKLALSFKYEIIEEIGRGGMASVYKASQKNLNRLVALKVIHQNLIYDNEFLQRFHQEAKLCASLNHPNIVTIYDEGAINNVHYMAMEYLLGNDLQRIIRYNKKVVVEDAIKIIISIANALDHAHNKGLIHRDIKSSNIIITNEGRAVLTDFGIAYAANNSRLTQTGSVIGTPEYMSPEQAKGIKTDYRSDIYSLGVVLFECITGKLPFAGDNPLTTIFKIINDTPPLARELNKEVPQWLSTIVNKTLEKDPNRRFQTGKELALALSNRKPITFEILRKNGTIKQNLVKKKSSNSKRIYKDHSFKKKNRRYYYWFLILSLVILLAVALIYFPSKFSLNHERKGINTADSTQKLENKIQSYLNRADSLYLMANYRDSYDSYLKVLDIDRRNALANIGLNNIYKLFLDQANNAFRNSNYRETIAIADSGLSLFLNDAELSNIKSEAEGRLNEPPPLLKIEVPYLIGLSKELAIETLKSKNLKAKITNIISEQKNLVTDQFPQSGAKLNPGGYVSLVIGE